MNRKLNTAFFSMCFLIAFTAEIYCIQDGDKFSVIGIGAVVLITGYLLIDAVRSSITKKEKEIREALDLRYREETDKWKEQYTQLINIQKATYTAVKKNNALFSEQYKEILERLEKLDNDNNESLKKIILLQKKSMEGQKNALNLEIRYNKENMKQQLGEFSEQYQLSEQRKQLAEIISLIKNGYKIPDELNQMDQEDGSLHADTENETDTSISEAEEAEAQPLTPIYEDPNKELSADEIASLFASFGNKTE